LSEQMFLFRKDFNLQLSFQKLYKDHWRWR